MEDLVEVWAVLDYTEVSVVERGMGLVKVRTLPEDRPTLPHPPASPKSCVNHRDADDNIVGTISTHCHYVPPKQHLFGPDFQRQALVDLTRLFNGRVVDVTMDSVTVEICAKPTRVDAFIALCRPYGILEVVRSGMIAMPRSPVDRSSMEDEDESGKMASIIDAAQLPPG